MTIAPTRQIVMSDMFVNNANVGDRKLKTVTTNFQEVEICRGKFYTGVVKREAVVTNNDFYSVIQTGEKYLLITNLDVMLSFNSGDGAYMYEMSAFIDVSNDNTFSYTGGINARLGKSLNTANVNDAPASTIQLGVTPTITGVSDYLLLESQIILDASGNRDNANVIQSSMFGDGRLVVIEPNSEVLIKSSFTGIDGNADIITMFYFKELSLLEFPQAEDI
jgi:hypothetical protein